MGVLVVTGAAGFIGSNLASRLNAEGFTNLILVDKFDNPAKDINLQGIDFTEKIDRDNFIEWLSENGHNVDFVFHLGARTDTAEFNFRVLDSLNLSYSKSLWEICAVKRIPLLYASSAATYGIGEKGFSDDHSSIGTLKPLNAYGLSKQLFDMHVLQQKQTPPAWWGLKFFNVYGPFESHKGRMASVVYHAYNQIKQTGKVKLFQSHRADYKDGEQLRDFIYVDDIIELCLFFFNSYTGNQDVDRDTDDDSSTVVTSGIYNAGTGRARTFNDLVKALFSALGLPPDIEYISIPTDIRDKYQYFTQAEMGKIRDAGFDKKFTSLELGVKNYAYFLKRG